MSAKGASTALEIVTPSYAADFDLCALLTQSTQSFAPSGTLHRLIVPRKDVPRFSVLAGDNVRVHAVDEFLPPGFVNLLGFNYWLNRKSLWPPVRGWIVQQLVKLAAAARSSAEAVLLVDSDMTFIRSFSVGDYAHPDVLSLYKLEWAIHPGMRRHLVWDGTARALLDLPPQPGRAHDYVCWPSVWRSSVVQSLLDFVSAKSGRHWFTTLGQQLHFSEMVLYGVFVDEIASLQTPVEFTDRMLCVNYFEETPLNDVTAKEFVSKVQSNDIAVMISAKSGTPMRLRRKILDALC